MIINGKSLLRAAPIKDMLDHKEKLNGVSYGLAEAGYDIRVKQNIHFNRFGENEPFVRIDDKQLRGRFIIASAIEEFHMPTDLVGIVHDKSTWARQGLSVFNTVIEPGWNGFLTLELVFHGNEPVTIPAGTGIAQVIFTRTIDSAEYQGKYQDQPDKPVASIFEDNKEPSREGAYDGETLYMDRNNPTSPTHIWKAHPNDKGEWNKL